MVSQTDTAVARIEVDEAATGDDRHIADHGTLSPADLNLVRKKRMDANRLTFGVLQLFFRQHGRFPRDMTATDLRALTPLIWEHVNPYGRFDLDMTTRLPLN